MKAKPAVTTALAIALCGGLLWAFPTLWMFLVLVLMGLLAFQANLVVRNMQVIARDAGGREFSVSAPPVMHAPPADAPKPVQDVSAALNRELFSRFRQHLEGAEQTPAAATPPAPATGPRPAPPVPSAPAAVGASVAEQLAADGVADRVAISGAAKLKPRPAPVAQRPRPKRPPEPEKEEDWFADLRPNPAAVTAAKPAPRQADDVAQGETTPRPEAPDEESATLLKMAEESLQRGDFPAARASLGQYLSLMQATPGAVPWQARRAQALLAAQEGDAAAALDAFENMLKAGYELKEEAVPALLDQMLAAAPADAAHPLRVSMLLKVLAVFRQNKDRTVMDRLYRMVEEAQEKAGDERKLIQFLKNHLEIKRVMGEAAGQIDLIDQIGNRLFKLGETAAAREYYEMGLKLRAEQQQAQAAAPAKAGSTQTA